MIIGILGRRKSGKDTVANKILERNSLFFKCAFADPLKREYARANNIDVSLLYDNATKEQYRSGMQIHGDARRAVDPYCYVKQLLHDTVDRVNLLITDVRFLEELESIVDLKGTPIMVRSDVPNRIKRGYVYNPAIDNHRSESELGDLAADTVRCLGGFNVWNNKGLMDLDSQIDQILLELSDRRSAQ